MEQQQDVDPFEVLADEHSRGRVEALFEALRYCVQVAMQKPPQGVRPENVRWVHAELAAAMDRFSSGEAQDLGDAFGLRRPKGWRQKQHQENHRVLTKIADVMRRCKKSDAGFMVAAEELGMCPKKVERLYYAKINPQISKKK